MWMRFVVWASRDYLVRFSATADFLLFTWCLHGSTINTFISDRIGMAEELKQLEMDLFWLNNKAPPEMKSKITTGAPHKQKYEKITI